MRMLTVADMMKTELRTLREDDSLSVADWELALSEIRHLPVVDEDGVLVGLVSDRDILRALAARPLGPSTVAQVMTRDVETVSPTTLAHDATERMLAARFGALPVVDASGVLLGLVTSTDFVELARRALAGHDVHQPHARA